MDGAQSSEFLMALLGSVFTRVIMPTLLMVTMIVSAWVLLARATRNPLFNFYEALLDENGKVSSQRCTTIGAFLVSSWGLCVVTLNSPDLFTAAFATYLGVWGTVSAATAIYRNKYPAPTSPGQEGAP